MIWMNLIIYPAEIYMIGRHTKKKIMLVETKLNSAKSLLLHVKRAIIVLIFSH